MIRKPVVAGAILLTLVGLAFVSRAWAAQQDKPSYTPAEYNAYTACANDKNAQTRAKCMEDFMAKFPQSSLLPYAYQLAYPTYNELRNFPKVIEYADKLLALGNKVDITTRVQASYTRALIFEYAYNPRDPNSPELLNKTVPFMAFIKGNSSFTTTRMTDHLLTNLWVIGHFLQVKIEKQGEIGKTGRVDFIHPAY